jgi:hypothetical protein
LPLLLTQERRCFTVPPTTRDDPAGPRNSSSVGANIVQ